MHKLLKEQVEQYLAETGVEGGVDPRFLDIVSASYHEAEENSLDLEMSLSIAYDELGAQREQLGAQLIDLEDAKGDIEQSLFLVGTILDLAHDGVMFMNNEGVPDIFNQAAMDMLGLSHNQLVNFSYKKFIFYLYRNVMNPRKTVESIMQDLKERTNETHILVEFKDGRFLQFHSKPQLSDEGVVKGRVWSGLNVTDLKKSEREATYNANHDRLTCLPNRALLFDRLEQAIANSKRSGKELAVLFMDLDGFKYVNDSMGHDIGDDLLKAVASRLQSVIREKDTLARLGGDEFVVLLEDVGAKAAIVEATERIMQCFEEAFVLKEKDIYVGTSVGISVYPSDAIDTEDLIKKADLAMYHAKNKGRKNFQFYSKNLSSASDFHLSIRNELSAAFKNNEFSLFYQPKVNLATREIVGAEALIRWYRDGEVVSSPLEFIAEAEQNGMIIPISEWVIKEVGKQVGLWNSLGFSDFIYGINISPQHFRNGDLVETLQEVIRINAVRPEQIIIEITEGTFISDVDATIRKLNTLRDIGFRIAVDDFGTGYSSFNYLKKLPLDILKVDREFTMAVSHSKQDSALVESILNIAKILKLSVVAEGVEDEATAKILESFGCDYGQGYWYSKPLGINDFEEFIKKPL